jgi:hypothetical protein
MKHCDGCDEDKEGVRRYTFKTPEGEKGVALWCPECVYIAGFDGPVGAAAGAGYTDIYELPEGE